MHALTHAYTLLHTHPKIHERRDIKKEGERTNVEGGKEAAMGMVVHDRGGGALGCR